jgi:hypothetical protein
MGIRMEVVKMRKIILFIFAVMALNATTPTYESVTRLYIATFDRTPDAAGLKYWVNDSGLELEEIARSFFDQPETKAKYYPDNTIYASDFVVEVYINLFDRLPDSAGKEYWVDEITKDGFSRASVFILAAINGAQGNDVIIIANKTKAALDAVRDQLPDNYYNIGVCSSFNIEAGDYYYEVTQGQFSLHCSYHNNNGRLQSETQYVDGVRHGSCREYFENGELRYAGDYWNGKREGVWIKY